MSCDNQVAFPSFIACMVVAIVAIHGVALARMVTEGLQPPAFSVIAGLWRAVDFASLVSVAYVVHEL